MLYNFFWVIIQPDQFFKSFLDKQEVDYITLTDKNGESKLCIKTHSFYNPSETATLIIEKMIEDNDLIRLKMTGSYHFIKSHCVAKLKNITLSEIDHWSLGKEFAWFKLHNRKTRRVQHSEPHPYKFTDSKLYSLDNDVYVVSKLIEENN